MKSKQLSKKLTLNKSTVTVLDNKEKSSALGGYYYTKLNASCYSWDPVCPTMPAANCVILPD